MAEIAKPNFHAGAEIIRAQAAKIDEQAQALNLAQARIRELETALAPVDRLRVEAERTLEMRDEQLARAQKDLAECRSDLFALGKRFEAACQALKEASDD